MYDSLNMHSLESSLIDIMRVEQDPMKGKMAFPFQSSFAGSEEGDPVQGGDQHEAKQLVARTCSVSNVVFPHTQAYFLPAESLMLMPPAAHLPDLKALSLLNLGSTQIWVNEEEIQEEV